MHCFAFHYFSNFQTILTTFQGVTSKKPPGSSLKWYFQLLRKLLKYENLGITNQMYMKLA